MSTGTTADFDLSRTELIKSALRLLGETEPSTTEISHGAQALNILTRHLDTKGDHLWTISNTENTLTLVAGQQAYVTGVLATTIKTNILKLAYASVYIGTNYEDLMLLDKPQSLRTPLRGESQSQPVAAYLERAKLLTGNRLLFYPTPNSAYTVKYAYRRPLYDFDTATDNPDFPSEFLKPLKYLLAYELSPEYGTPIQERQGHLSDGERAWKEATAFNSDRPSYKTLATEYF